MQMQDVEQVPTVILDREQRDVLWDKGLADCYDAMQIDQDGGARFLVATGRLLEALEGERDTYELPVDDRIAWLAENCLVPFVDEFCKETPAEYRAMIAATEAISGAAAGYCGRVASPSQLYR